VKEKRERNDGGLCGCAVVRLWVKSWEEGRRVKRGCKVKIVLR
jgi:hypothetical protein